MRRLVDDLGPWTDGSGPLLRRLARAVTTAIDRGRLRAGDRLPSERALAAALWTSRGTVVAAYDLLEADGLIERRTGSGTFVTASDAVSLPPDREGSALLARLVGDAQPGAEPIDLSLAVLHEAPDLPDLRLRVRDLTAEVSPWGVPELRATIADRLTSEGLRSEPEQVVVTTGAHQALHVSVACWVRPGDRVVVEDPTYPGAIAVLRAAGADLVGVPTDSGGVSTSALATALEARPSLVYLQSAVHNPTGALLAPGRRTEIARLLGRHRVPLVEDLALSGLAWDPVPAPIASHLPADHPAAVIGSFSKLLWSGLRVGYVRAPEPLTSRLARIKGTQDLGSSVAGQVLAVRLLAHPATADALARRTAELQQRHRHLAEALASRLPSWRADPPAGGLGTWVRLPEPVARPLAQVALRAGVAVATADGLSPRPGSHPDRVRISFALPVDQLDEGVERLRWAWDQVRSS